MLREVFEVMLQHIFRTLLFKKLGIILRRLNLMVLQGIIDS